MNPDWHLVKKLLLWKWERRKLNKSLSKTLVCIFYLFLWTGIMLAIFHVLRKTPWLSQNDECDESTHYWVMWTEMLWNPWAFVEFSDFIIEVISFVLMETLFKRLSVFINNRGSLLLFSKEVHWEAKYSLNIFTFSTIFIIVSSDIRLRGTEGILMLFRKLFKMVQ